MKDMKEKKFFLIISICTLVVMSLGATFAYYSAVISSDNDGISLESQNISLGLSITNLYTENTIIPTNDEDIDKAFENECIDDYGYGACYAFDLVLTNNGIPQDLNGIFKLSSETIRNLKFMFLDADNGNEVFEDISDASSGWVDVGDEFHLDSGESKNFILIIWLSNLNDEQDYDTGGVFLGEFNVRSSLGSVLTGTISAANN